MNSAVAPFELQELERLLNQPNSDASGLASFFTAGEIFATRVPARLDVMGGIADYSGANVCEAVLGRGVLMGLQTRTDRTLRIRTMQAGTKALPIETRLPLSALESGSGLASYAEIRALCQANPLASWATYIVGSIFTLLKEEKIQLPYGFNLLLLSAIPMNVGIGSSAAVEVGTLSCLNSYLSLNLSPSRIAQLGQMAAVVAHEVRNPLAGIRGAMQILLSRRPGSDPEGSVMRDIVARIDSLGDLINDLMVFARPRAPRLTPIELQGLVMDAITMARRDPSAANVEISVAGESGSLTGDGELIRAAVLNLLLNAAQALGGRGRIAVRLTASDGAFSVAIQDDGPGVPAEIRERVLEPFFTTKARGGGLGLPIARRTAELHGGTLTLACPEEGGTLVTLTLPAPRRPLAPTP